MRSYFQASTRLWRTLVLTAKNPTLTNPARLKLKLYRTLGIDVEADETTGQYNKAVIRNAAKGDVHVVNIDPKFSRHFYTNYFWRTM